VKYLENGKIRIYGLREYGNIIDKQQWLMVVYHDTLQKERSTMKRTRAEQHDADVRRAELVNKAEKMPLKEMCEYLDVDIPEFPVVIINGMKSQARKNGDNLYTWILRHAKEPRSVSKKLHENQEDLYRALNMPETKK
jgi:hypothetical protein